ncbi:hypothetical protein D9619_000230 [Psilocybe cf. subviscida]|uniref:Uncharacterized protein n=1 Tax=Psilocybe cf. subviscida TaxID=2480587 RepID=A0A8H5F3Z3_9AGAR|nr:hypothetical protein D9619_000230 [Psilocybe cf. subviscida]
MAYIVALRCPLVRVAMNEAGRGLSKVAPMHAMFQDARNTNIQSATFNIYGSTASTSASTSSDSATLQQSISGPLIAWTSVPMNLMATSAGSVLPPDPIPTPFISPETYVHHLITKNRGYPLWIPSPSMRLPECNRASGVRIGDVGIITPEGAFLFLFNVFHEATHPINASMRLPIDFVPFTRDAQTNPCDIDEFKESSAGSYLADESLIRMDEGNDRLRTVLKTSAAHAAVLMMPEPVYASKLRSTVLFQNYVRDNIKSWYRFVRMVLGLEVNNGDLRVVYGCRKSAAFGIATVSNSTHRRGSESASEAPSTELTFSIDHSWMEITGCKYRWHHRGSAEVKAGPSFDENRDIQQDMTGASNLQFDHIINQCLFVSTIDFTLPEHEWQLLICDDLVSVTTSHWCPNTQSPSSASTQSAFPGGYPSGSSHSTLSGFGPELSFGHPYQGFEMRTTAPWRYLLTYELQKPFNPSDTLAQSLLRVVPQATVVALCSDDWGPFMTDSVQTVAAFIHDTLSANNICYDDGMVYLSSKSRATDHSKLTVPFGARMANKLGKLLHKPYMTLLIQKHDWSSKKYVQCGMMLTKTPSPNARPARITIKLSDLMTNVDELLPLASLIQVLLAISLPWRFRIISPRRRDEPHAVYNECLESNSSALANKVRELIEKAHIRKERRALRRQGVTRVPSGPVSDCNFTKIAEWLNIEAEYGLGAESILDRMPSAPTSPPVSKPNQTPVNLPIAEPLIPKSSGRTAPPKRSNRKHTEKRELGSIVHDPQDLHFSLPKTDLRPRKTHEPPLNIGANAWTTEKTAPRPRKIRKRLLVNGAHESSFHHTFGRQRTTSFPPAPPPTDTPAQDQQTGSSHRNSDPQELAEPYGFPVVQQSSQAAHTVQHRGQTVGTYPVSGYYHVQSGDAAPMPNDTMGTGEATPLGILHFPSAYSHYAVDPMYVPHDTEFHFDPGAFYATMSQMHPQGSPTRSQWNQASITFPHDIGSMGYSQYTGAQQGISSGDQTLDHHLPYMQQNIDNRSSSQFPSMDGASHHADSSAASGSHYLPSSSSLGGRLSKR